MPQTLPSTATRRCEAAQQRRPLTRLALPKAARQAEGLHERVVAERLCIESCQWRQCVCACTAAWPCGRRPSRLGARGVTLHTRRSWHVVYYRVCALCAHTHAVARTCTRS
jgi:hypothetical protein